MINRKLLTGLLVAALSGAGVCSFAASPVVFSLEEIFESAEANSAQLRPALSAQRVADNEVAVARSARLPEISAQLSLSYIGDGFTTRRNFSDYQSAPIPHLGNGAELCVEQALYAGGAISAGIELAELRSTAARYAADFQRDNIRFRLMGFYLDLYKYSNLRRVVGQNIVRARKVLGEMNARHAQGTALRNDITRYELLVSELELQLVRIDNMLDILNSNLVVTAGLPEGTVVVPDSTILARALPADGEESWQQSAQTNSPALLLAGTEVGISRRNESMARAERLPHIALRAAASIDGPILVEVPPIDRNLAYWYVGIGVRYNLSSLYKSNKKVRSARLATQQAIDRLDAERENVGLTIRADYVRYLEAYEEMRTLQKSVELAVSNYNTTSTRYSADMALITDMLDAANSRLDAEQRLVNARINIIYYYYKLLFTSGKI